MVCTLNVKYKRKTKMNEPETETEIETTDTAEQAVTHAHVIVPILGGFMIFLMAFIAVLFGAPG